MDQNAGAGNVCCDGSCQRCCDSDTFKEFFKNVPMVLQGVIKNATEAINNIPTPEELSNMLANMLEQEVVVDKMPKPEKMETGMPKFQEGVKKILHSLQSMVHHCV